MVSVLPFCIRWLFTLSVIRNLGASVSSALVVGHGPSGLNMSQLLPLLHCPPRSRWNSRSETWCEMQYAAMQAAASWTELR